MSGNRKQNHAKPDCGGAAKAASSIHRETNVTAPVLDSTRDSTRNRVNECKRLWVLKNSLFVSNSQIWGIENVYPTRENRLWGFLTRFCFCEFRGQEFFNSHA
jgi:hypothetical protein